MKLKTKIILLLSSFFGISSKSLADEYVTLSGLKIIGFNIKNIQKKFARQNGRTIDLNENLKVSSEDEGKQIKFETFDNYSVIVNRINARAPHNKDVPKGNE